MDFTTTVAIDKKYKHEKNTKNSNAEE